MESDVTEKSQSLAKCFENLGFEKEFDLVEKTEALAKFFQNYGNYLKQSDRYPYFLEEFKQISKSSKFTEFIFGF